MPAGLDLVGLNHNIVSADSACVERIEKLAGLLQEVRSTIDDIASSRDQHIVRFACDKLARADQIDVLPLAGAIAPERSHLRNGQRAEHVRALGSIFDVAHHLVAMYASDNGRLAGEVKDRS